MFLFLIVLLASFIIAAILFVLSDIPVSNFFHYLIKTVAFILIITGIGFFIFGLTISRETTVVNKEYKIVAMKDNSTISGYASGNIFIMSGHVDGKIYYYYMQQTDQGYIMSKSSADETYIVETEAVPKVVIKQEQYVNENANTFLVNLNFKTQTIAYVPRGTVMQEFKVDME